MSKIAFFSGGPLRSFSICKKQCSLFPYCISKGFATLTRTRNFTSVNKTFRTDFPLIKKTPLSLQNKYFLSQFRSFYNTNNDKSKGSDVDASTKQNENSVTTEETKEKSKDLYENIYTLPNYITLARIAMTPFIGYAVVHNDYYLATCLLAVAGLSDLVDGYIARKWNLQSVMGSILDPAADKFLMTVMVASLASQGNLPLYLAAIIIGRDVALSISAFYFRYISLPPPRTFVRFWDFSIPSAQVNPTTISKYNTFLQLSLIAITTVAPVLPVDISLPLTALQLTVAGTTIASGLSYVFSKTAVKFLR